MINISSFYKFVEIKDLLNLKSDFKKFLENYKIKGNIILSLEGINGTISGEKNNLDSFFLYSKKKLNISKFDVINESISKSSPFKRLKIKLKNEVVPINELVEKDFLNNNKIEPKDWNKFILEKDVQLIDIRKDFEIEIGSFKNSINPKVKDFRKFPEYFKKINNKKLK